MSTNLPPRWDLSNVYPSSSADYVRDFEKLSHLISEMEKVLTGTAAKTTGKEEKPFLAALASDLASQILMNCSC